MWLQFEAGPHRLTVRTEAFQALNRSSILRGVTKDTNIPHVRDFVLL